MKIAVIGSGYVGLVTGACFSEFGYEVVCIDKDKKKIAQLRKNVIPIYEPGLSDLIKKNVKSKYLSFSNNLKNVKGSKIIFIAVGTPSARRGDGEADLKYVFEVCKNLAGELNKKDKSIIVTKSTVPIGTGKKIKSLFEKYSPSLTYGLDYNVASNPEFLREGSAIEDFLRPDRVVCGVDNESSLNILKELYRPLNLRETPVLFTDIESAELIKYASNAFLALKISFINEMSDLCEKVGGNVQMVAKGMGLDNRIGSKFLHPGPGFGGSCFPKDTRALHASFKKNKVKSTLVKSVIDFNEQRKINMFKKVTNLLKKPYKDRKVTFLGVTFKPNTDDLRESPSLTIIPRLKKLGLKIIAHDPSYKKAFHDVKEFKGVIWKRSISEAIKGTDLIVIHTEWNEYRAINFRNLRKFLSNPILLDFRNIFNKTELNNIGYLYYNLGTKEYEKKIS